MTNLVNSCVLVLTFIIQFTNGWYWPQLGRCPNMSVKQNFTLEKYLGTWYQQAGAHVEFEGRGRCLTANYTYDYILDVINVVNQKINEPSNTLFTMEGTAVLEDPSKKEGKLIVTLPSHFFGWEVKFVGPYWVLDTDYDSYAVVYSCMEFLWMFHYYSSIILSRRQDLYSLQDLTVIKFYNKTHQVVKDHNLNMLDFTLSRNMNCTL